MSDFKVIDWEALPSFGLSFFKKGVAISIGGFDGLHIGHMALLEELKKKAKGMLKGVLTFYTPPAYMLSASSKHGLISTWRLKKEKLIRLGFDFAILVDFSSNFAKMKAEDFIGLLKKYLNLGFLVVGNDFHFGYNRISGIEDMRFFSCKFSFVFEAVEPLVIDEKAQKVSSSFLRTCIYEGNIEYVNSLLAEPFTIDLLDLTPCAVEEKEIRFRRKDIVQVLPKDGKFKGVVCFNAPVFEEKTNILLDENYLRLIFENVKLNKGLPYFDKLQFV